jgi:hypothetical protein
MIKDYKTLLIFSIPYFTACGGLYHLAFWSTFDINGLAYIGLQDVIKSFVYPFISLFILFVFSVILNETIFRTDKIFPSGGGRTTNLGKKLNSNIGISISLIVWLTIVLILFFNDNIDRWYLWAIVTGMMPATFLDRIELLHNYINNERIRKYTIWLLVYIPIFSFASGKYQSQLIQQNIKYKYTLRQKFVPNSNTFATDTLKFIGNTDKQIFLTDLNNSTIFILRTDNIDTLILKQHD